MNGPSDYRERANHLRHLAEMTSQDGPDVQLEVHADAPLVDIVAKGFDAGIGPKDWAAEDLIAA
jgi:DNA-binding transcriptional LysR family regulator